MCFRYLACASLCDDNSRVSLSFLYTCNTSTISFYRSMFVCMYLHVCLRHAVQKWINDDQSVCVNLLTTPSLCGTMVALTALALTMLKFHLKEIFTQTAKKLFYAFLLYNVFYCLFYKNCTYWCPITFTANHKKIEKVWFPWGVKRSFS